MKTLLKTLLVSFTVLSIAHHAAAQPTAFSYQGELFFGTNPANGRFDLSFALSNAPSGGAQVGATLSNLNTAVNNGLFTVPLDFGSNVFNGQNLWLNIGVRTNGGGAFTQLTPLQILSVPYAVFAGGANTASGVAPGSVTGAGIAIGTITGSNIASGSIVGGNIANGTILGGNIANSTITGPNIANGQVVRSLNFLRDNIGLLGGTNVVITQNGQNITVNSAGWSLVGNAGTTPGTNFIGTTDDVNLEVHVNGQRAMLFEPVFFGIPNIVMGSPSNKITSTVGGNTIAGGDSNNITGGFAAGNCFIGAGVRNVMPFDFPGANCSAIVGGLFNTNDAQGSTIAGGYGNTIDNASGYAFIGSGSNNFIANNNGGFHSGDSYSSIVGGVGNTVGSFLGMMFIGGGRGNVMVTSNSTSPGLDGIPGDSCSAIVGGFSNVVSANTVGVFIGGGSNNMTLTPPSPYTAYCPAIVGGAGNSNGSSFTFIGAGSQNEADQFSDNSAIVGGSANQITQYAGWAFIGGGASNMISGQQDEEFVATATYDTIGGGLGNVIQADSPTGFIGGGISNVIQTETSASVIGGGFSNTNGGDDSVIGGGAQNTISSPEGITGYATIGGGLNNVASAPWSTVPGGQGNVAAGNGSFAVGQGAQAMGQGSFVWSTGAGGGFTETEDNVFIIGGVAGVGVNTGSPNATLDVRGNINSSEGIAVTSPSTPGQPVGQIDSGGAISGSSLAVSGAVGCASVQCTGQANVGDLTVTGTANIGTANIGGATIGALTVTSCIQGSFCQPSDRNLKENFAEIDSREILRRVSAMPIGSWSYKTDGSVRHIGPMAQDFYAQFRIGMNDKTIMTVDEGGVALAAIQGLDRELTEKDAEIRELKAKAARVDALEKRLDEIEALLNQLAAQR